MSKPKYGEIGWHDPGEYGDIPPEEPTAGDWAAVLVLAAVFVGIVVLRAF